MLVQGYSAAAFASLPLPETLNFEDDPGFGPELDIRPSVSLEPGTCFSDSDAITLLHFNSKEADCLVPALGGLLQAHTAALPQRFVYVSVQCTTGRTVWQSLVHACGCRELRT